MSLQLRRVDDRIRDLCAKALAADSGELNFILPQLRSALHLAIERLRLRAVGVMNGREVPRERRKIS
jgi:hypothetical protein